MTEQMNLGIENVARNNKRWVDAMKSVARSISRKDGHVSSDQLVNTASVIGEPLHPNAWGAIFRNTMDERGAWVCVGYKQSDKPSRKGGIIRVWKFRTSS